MWIRTETPLFIKIAEAVKNLKAGTAPGLDSTPVTKILQNNPDETACIFYPLTMITWESKRCLKNRKKKYLRQFKKVIKSVVTNINIPNDYHFQAKCCQRLF